MSLNLSKLKLPKFLKDLITGPDGETFDAVRVAFVGSVIVFLAMAVIDVIQNKHVDFVAYGTGFGALSAGAGAGVAVKQIAGAEPPAPDNSAATPDPTPPANG